MHRAPFILFLLLVPIIARTQNSLTETFQLAPGDSLIRLSSEFILEGSETVILNGDSLRRHVDYSLDRREGILHLRPRVQGGSSPLIISYSFIPVSFKRRYFLKSIEVKRDTSGKETRRVQPSSAPLSLDDFFGSSISKNGSLLRGFTIGSNRDLTLTSGFRMQMNGQLANDVDMVAVLTDENTPIQPEGTTQTLQEVDKVFVEFTHPSFGATLGDFNETITGETGGEFGRVSRKLQGARGRASTGAVDAGFGVTVVGGSPRGKYFTNEFRGKEGSQGPYRLSGASGERQIIIIAGSERVYVDGIQMTRGDVNDYVIEYASSEITFTSRRLITNASRILVDFEYADRKYERNFFNTSASGSLFRGGVRLNALFIQEADDLDSPLDVSLDAAARTILSQSGADPLKGSVWGVQVAGRDSVTNTPRGQYVRKDTVIAGNAYQFFEYAPGDSLAIYSVTFSPVENMPADSAGYDRVSLGQFRFAGIGRGSYLPLKTIPLPSIRHLVDFNAEASVLPDLSISGEFAASRFDRNRISGVDDSLNDDQAMRLGIRYNPKNLNFLGMNAGEFDLKYSERFVGGRFVPPDRFNEVEFDRKWNIEGFSPGDERIREFSAEARPSGSLYLRTGYGSFEREGAVRSDRIEGALEAGDSSAPALRYKAEHISSSEGSRNFTSDWLRHGGTASHSVSAFRPAVSFETEQRDLHVGPGDSLAGGSFRFVQWSPSLQMEENFGMKASAEVQLRTEDSVLAGAFRRSSRSMTQLYTWQLLGWNDLSGSVTLSARKTRFEDDFRLRGNQNSDVVMVRSQVRYAPPRRAIQTDAFYEFSNQRSSRLERVYVRVAKGEGNYRYLGDLNGNTIPEDNEFEPTRFDGDFIVLFLPGENLYPVASLKSSIRLRLQLSHMFDRTSFPGSFLAPFSTETYARIDERSSDPRTENIYFLRLGAFLSPAHTISGSQILTQDIHFNENEASFSARLRFNQRRGLIQLVNSGEAGYSRERSLRVRTRLISELGNESEFVERRDRLLSSTTGPRDRDLAAYALSSDFSYRPEREWEVGFRLHLETTTDRLRGDRAVADMNEQTLRIVYAFLGKGQLRIDGSREEAILSQPSRDVQKIYAFEFTQGRVFGKTYLWSVSFDYRITQNIQLTVHYNGRTEGGRSPVHLARAEAKAFF